MTMPAGSRKRVLPRGGAGRPPEGVKRLVCCRYNKQSYSSPSRSELLTPLLQHPTHGLDEINLSHPRLFLGYGTTRPVDPGVIVAELGRRSISLLSPEVHSNDINRLCVYVRFWLTESYQRPAWDPARRRSRSHARVPIPLRSSAYPR
jgi:hypothetical protein